MMVHILIVDEYLLLGDPYLFLLYISVAHDLINIYIFN